MAGWSGVLGRLAIVLGLDKKGYEADLKAAAKAAGLKTKEMQADFDALNFNKFRRGMIAAGGMIAAWGVKEKLTETMHAYQEQEKATVLLDSALQSLGIHSKSVSDYFAALASEFQKTTRYADESLLPMLATLMQVGGVQIPQVNRVMRAAMDWSAKGTIDLGTAVDLLSKAAAGNTERLKRYGIMLSDNVPKAQRFEEALKLLESRYRGMEEAAAFMTDEGKIKRMNNAWGEFAETIGGPLSAAWVKVLGVMTAIGKLTFGAPNQGIQDTQQKRINELQEKVKQLSDTTATRAYPAAFQSEIAKDLQAAQDELNALRAGQPYVPPGVKVPSPAVQIKPPTDFDYSRMAGVGGRAFPKLRGGAGNVFEGALKARGERKLKPSEYGDFLSPEDLAALSYERDRVVNEMEERYRDFAGNVQSTWSSAMSNMMMGSMRWRDFTKEMFSSVERSFLDMVSRMAAQKLYDATLGKLAGSVSVQEALKYRTAGSALFRGTD